MIDEIKTFRVNLLGTNCYIFRDKSSGKYAMVDPGGKTKELCNYLEQAGENIEYILLTHGHFDHIMFASFFKNKYGCKIVMNKLEKEFAKNHELNLSQNFRNKVEPFEPDILLDDGECLNLGDSKIKMIATPGHTAGGACYIVDRNIFTGDTLFKGSAGRCDFITGDAHALLNSLKKLERLEGDYVIYPGHDAQTTLDYERKYNIYLSNR